MVSLGSGLIGLIALICLVWVIYDVWVNQTTMDSANKIIWTIAAILFSIITAIVYYFVIKK